MTSTLGDPKSVSGEFAGVLIKSGLRHQRVFSLKRNRDIDYKHVFSWPNAFAICFHNFQQAVSWARVHNQETVARAKAV
tara:strand:+ start:656 stop:892 length:237 start_codon:yes stop_codon:yes gene_type:complete